MVSIRDLCLVILPEALFELRYMTDDCGDDLLIR
jgi:hypothetical protein